MEGATTREEVQVLAGEILPPMLGPVGFASVDVAEREDSVGEDAFYVLVRMTPEAEHVRSPAYGDALVAMPRAPAERGERRFAYVDYDWPSDPPPSADDDEES